MQAIINFWAIIRQCGRSCGPYVMIELVLPGGTLFALLLLLHRQGKLAGIADAARRLVRHLLPRSPDFEIPVRSGSVPMTWGFW